MIVAIYLLKMLSCSAVLTAYYYFFLRNRSFHQYNRYFLLLIFLSSLLLPFVRLPFLNIASDEALPVFKTFSAEMLPEVVLTVNREASIESNILSNFLLVIYIVVVSALLYRIVHSIMYITRLSKESPSKLLGSLKIFFTNEPGTPFSFFSWIF